MRGFVIPSVIPIPTAVIPSVMPMLPTALTYRPAVMTDMPMHGFSMPLGYVSPRPVLVTPVDRHKQALSNIHAGR
jgi:hypothetical protein